MAAINTPIAPRFVPLVARLARARQLAVAHPRASIATFAAFLVYCATIALLGGASASAAAFAALALVALVAWLSASDDERRLIGALSVSALVIRTIAAGLLDAGLTSVGREGALFNDDLGYIRLARALAASWHGDPGALQGVEALQHDPSINSLYVAAAAALFTVVGPASLALKALNTCLAVLAALFVYRTMRNHGFAGARWGLLLMLSFPSIVLWSALALKDAYVLFFMTMALWTVSEFVRTRRLLPWYAIFIVALLAIENVRTYLFVLLAVAWPLAVVIAAPMRLKLRAGALAALGTLGLLTLTPALTYLDPRIVTAPSIVRQGMQQDARTAFGETTTPSVEPPSASDSVSISRSIRENLAHLPLGVLYVLGAPFPLTAQTRADLATIPEMVLWYAVVLLAFIGLYQLFRHRRWDYVFGLLMLGEIGLILSLVEGNVGTLFRHRAMLIPFVVIPAAIGLDRTIAFLRERRAGDDARAASTVPGSR